jgi:serine/threonine protein kinase
VGVKVLVDPNLTRDQVVQALQFEQKVSHSLPSSCSQRRVLRVDTFQDLPAMYFKWVEGVDMGELLKPEPDETGKNQFSMDTRLQLALAITKAVCDFHDAGVFHGNLNLENVIMDFNEGTRNYKATLIDYSKSVIMSDASHNTLDEQDRHAFFEEKKHNDLSDLGVILYYVLSNNNIPDALGEEVENSSNDVDAQGIKRGRHDVQTPNLPLYLASLVSALLGHTRDVEGHRRLVYKSSREVLLDLQLAAQKPGIYLKVQFWTEMLFKPLDVPHDSFHGRRTELSILQHSYNTMMEGGSKPCALVVSGCAGAG